MQWWRRWQQDLVQALQHWRQLWRPSPTQLQPTRAPGVSAAPAPAALPAALLRCVSVVIPALNEERRIADVVAYALGDSATAEVIVVDDASIDATRERALAAGARVITSTMLGKGPSMADGSRAAQHELVVFLDGDLAGLRPGIISSLARPLAQGEADFVKARFGRGGGRVTELTARPMLQVFFPELAGHAQPLGGVIAVRRQLLQQLRFEDGYGVDIGLLLDAWRAGARLQEVDIGHLEHESQPLMDLTVMANEVSRVIYQRARDCGRLHIDQIAAMYENQRQATASWDYLLTRRKGRKRLLLLDMDGTVTTARFVTALAQATGLTGALSEHLDSRQGDAMQRSTAIAHLWRFVHRQRFEQVARELPLRPGIIECVNAFKRAGFMVGLVSDSYFVAAEVVRKRIFADFALAHTVQFNADVCSGALTLNPAFLPLEDDEASAPLVPAEVPASQALLDDGPVSKRHVIERFRRLSPAFDVLWAVGDNDNDVPLLTLADRGFAIEPKTPRLRTLDGVQVIERFEELLQALQAAGLAQEQSTPA